jgi:uncharacterized protein (TIGR00156 family)
MNTEHTLMGTIKLAAGVVGTALIALAWQAFAQSQDQSSSTESAWSVKRVLAEAKDDQRVTVRGKVVRTLGDEDFILTDDTGEIRIEVDDDQTKQKLQVGANVEVHGEADRDTSEPTEIEAERVVSL